MVCVNRCMRRLSMPIVYAYSVCLLCMCMQGMGRHRIIQLAWSPILTISANSGLSDAPPISNPSTNLIFI